MILSESLGVLWSYCGMGGAKVGDLVILFILIITWVGVWTYWRIITGSKLLLSFGPVLREITAKATLLRTSHGYATSACGSDKFITTKVPALGFNAEGCGFYCRVQ